MNPQPQPGQLPPHCVYPDHLVGHIPIGGRPTIKRKYRHLFRARRKLLRRLHWPKVLLLSSLAILWVPFLWHMETQWALFEQYRYGLVMPFVCLFLLLKRLSHEYDLVDHGAGVGGQESGGSEQEPPAPHPQPSQQEVTEPGQIVHQGKETDRISHEENKGNEVSDVHQQSTIDNQPTPNSPESAKSRCCLPGNPQPSSQQEATEPGQVVHQGKETDRISHEENKGNEVSDVHQQSTINNQPTPNSPESAKFLCCLSGNPQPSSQQEATKATEIQVHQPSTINSQPSSPPSTINQEPLPSELASRLVDLHYPLRSLASRPTSDSAANEEFSILKWVLDKPRLPLMTSVKDLFTRYRWLFATILLLLLALFPVRLVHEANPLWRLTTWTWAMSLVMITLAAVYIAGGRSWLKLFWVPVLFMLLAIPWPYGLEKGVVDALSGANSVAVAEILNTAGVPAVRHGNTIEVATGVVGLEEACSGIRSLQMSLAIALLAGEYLRLSFLRRLLLVLFGLGLALGFNVVRTTTLAWVAASKGIGAVQFWHDHTGISAGLITLFGIALVGLYLRRSFIRERWEELKPGVFPVDPNAPPDEPPEDSLVIMEETNTPLMGGTLTRRLLGFIRGDMIYPLRYWPYPEAYEEGQKAKARHVQPLLEPSPLLHTRPIAYALIAFVLVSELGTAGWYAVQEANAHLPQPVRWSAVFPTNSSGFKVELLNRKALASLWCDVGITAQWIDGDFNQWLVNYVRWNPSHTGPYLARFHTPESCLPGTGWKVKTLPGSFRMGPMNPPLLFRAVRIMDEYDRAGFLFFALADDHRQFETETADKVTRVERVRGVWKARQIQGMSVLEVAVWGYDTLEQARLGVERLLPEMIKVEE